MMDLKQMQFVVDRVFPFVSGCPEATIRAVAEAAVAEYVTDIGGIHTWTNPAPFTAKDGSYRLSPRRSAAGSRTSAPCRSAAR